MAVADNKLRLMPSHDDLTDARSQELGYNEGRLLTNPIESSLKGQVIWFTLHQLHWQYVNYISKSSQWHPLLEFQRCRSMINISTLKTTRTIKSMDGCPRTRTVGLRIITPSNEFKNGGPMKADLTSHTGPTCLSMFHSAHYAGIDLCPQFRNGEAWKKVFGPVYVYLNQKPVGTSVRHLWDDAKHK
ncbi:hypothetical protein Mapa_014639 [Marchantia paleacea]|nr:hypothetical protein Mapa_014639 [Marchantia paleacea]